MMVAYRDCTFINNLGGVIRMKNGAAFYCSKCKIFSSNSRTITNYAGHLRAIQSELPQGVALTSYITQSTLDHFASEANTEQGAVHLHGVSNPDSKKKIKTPLVTLRKDYLAYEAD